MHPETRVLTHEWDALSDLHKNVDELQGKNTKEFKGFLDCLLLNAKNLSWPFLSSSTRM